MLDDTDRWHAKSYVPDAAARRDGFFTQVLRVMAEDLAVAAVVAVHPEYLHHPAYQSAVGFLDDTVYIPELTSSEAVRKIVARRAALALTDADEVTVMSTVATPQALEVLFSAYQREPNIRARVIAIMGSALLAAVDDDSGELISEGHVRDALSEALGGI